MLVDVYGGWKALIARPGPALPRLLPRTGAGGRYTAPPGGRGVEVAPARRVTGSIEDLSKHDPKNFLKWIAKRQDVDPDGFLDVVVHANQEACEIAGIPATPEYLARIVAQDKKCTGKVRLIACLTGNSDVPGGGPCFAQRFANALKKEMDDLRKVGKVEVQGTNGMWIATETGAHGEFPAKKVDGKWVEDPNPNATPAQLIIFTPN